MLLLVIRFWYSSCYLFSFPSLGSFLAELILESTLKHFLHTGLYKLMPPISSIVSLSAAIRLVKLASLPQSTQIAVIFVTYSAIGSRFTTLPNDYIIYWPKCVWLMSYFALERCFQSSDDNNLPRISVKLALLSNLQNKHRRTGFKYFGKTCCR